MSLVRKSFADVVKQQFLYKLKAYKGVFTSLIIVQIIAFIFSMSGIHFSGYGSTFTFININHYNSDMIIIFTMMWAFITAITITRKENQLMDASYVTNLFTSHLSNIAFIVFMSIVGAISAMMAGFLYKMLFLIYKGTNTVFITGHYSVSDLLLGAGSITIYLLLLTGIGYLVGMLIQWHPIFKIILPSILVAAIYFGDIESSIFVNIISFYGMETDLLLLTIKVILTFILCTFLSIGLSSRTEVRQ